MKGILIAVLAFIGFRIYERFFLRDLSITFLDVGQGDSALVEFPGSRRMLIDSGGMWTETGRRVLIPELTRKSILTLDKMVLSHPDQDHGQGFIALLEVINVQEFLYSALLAQKAGLLQRLRVLARNQKALKERPISEPLGESIGNAKLLWIPPSSDSKKTNDQSLCLLIQFGGCRVLFTGDLEAEGEKNLLTRLPPGPIHLLKGAHHGSRTSSQSFFLEKTKPQWVVLSTGLHNHYGHPHGNVVRRFREQGTQVLRTDFHGYVSFRITKRGDVLCHSARGPCGEAKCR